MTHHWLTRHLRIAVAGAIALTLVASCGGSPSAPATNAGQTTTASNASLTAAGDGGDTTAQNTADGDDAGNTAAADTNSGDAGSGDAGSGDEVASLISATVDGQKYEAQSSETTCSTGATSGNSFGNQYSDAAKQEGLSSLQLIVDDVAAAKAGTSEFTLTITIGPLGEGTDYTVAPGTGEGDGTLTLDYGGGSTASATFSGTTADGASVNGTLQCRQIINLG